MLSRALFAVILLLPPHPAAQAHKPPPLNEILDRTIARSEQDDKNETAGHEIVANERSVVDLLNDNGTVKEHSEYLREPVLIGGRVFLRTISRNGQPLTGKYLDKEKDREIKFRATLAKNKDQARRRDPDQDLKLDRELFNRFLISIEGEEPVNGRPAWKLNFHPKPGEKPERTRAERVVNHVAGKLWVDEDQYEIVRVDMALTEPIAFYGIVANIRALHFRLEQKLIQGTREGDLWTPTFTDLLLDGRALFTSLHQHSHSVFSNFRLQSDLK